MRKKVYIIGLAFSLLSLVNVDGQVHIARKEKARDRIEIRVSKVELRRDKNEMEAFKAKTAEFKNTFAAGDEQRLNVLHAELVGAMQREIEQSKKKSFSDKKEVSRSNREIANSRRDEESNKNRRFISSRDQIREMRDDQRDTRDDVRDARNDNRDLDLQLQRTRKQYIILEQFLGWHFQGKTGGDPEIVPEILLLKQFISTLQEDIIATRIEVGEDRRELWEDRREIRENKQDRRER